MKRILNDLLERAIHIEGKIDRIEERLNSTSTEIKKIENNSQKYYKKSYAQFGEDVLIWNIFQQIKIENPTYIDIGAHHPYELSNTALMHENNCTGINVEANPNLYEAFPKERANDINICCGVGKETGTLPFYMIDERSGRNSFVKENVEEFINRNPNFKISEIKQIPIITLTEIIEKFAGGKFPDYLSIDIEGLEYDVLSSYDLKENGPKVITIEIFRNHIELKSKIEDMLERSDYFIYIKSGSNYTWVKNQYKEIILA